MHCVLQKLQIKTTSSLPVIEALKPRLAHAAGAYLG